MSKEAMKLALDALEGLEALLLSMGLTHLIVYGDAEKAITNLQKQLEEQPAQQQQDDAWKAEQKTLADEAVKCATEALANPNHPATMAAREYYGAAQRKPLTFSKLCDIEYEITHRDGDFSILKFARAIEAAHGIKENT